MEKEITSRKSIARAAAVAWILGGAAIGFSLIYVRPRILVTGDAAASVANILAFEDIFRTGIAASLAGHVLMLVLGVLMYRLFAEVSKSLATFSLLSIAISVCIGAVNSLGNIAALFLVTNPDTQKLFPAAELNILTLTFLRTNNTGIGVVEIFTALFLFTTGLLMVRSGYVPAVIGILMMAGSLGFPINTFAKILMPQYYPATFTQVAMFGGAISSLPPMLWLLVRGVKGPVKSDE